MPPDQLTQIDQLLQRIAEQSQATQIIILVLALVAFGIVLLRSFGGRDKSMTTVVTQLSLLISHMNDAAEKREQVNNERLQLIETRNKQADEDRALFAAANAEALKHHATAVANNTTAVQALDRGMTASMAALSSIDQHLTLHDQVAKSGIADILIAIGKVEDKVDNALKSIAEIKAFYPNGESPLAKVERELAEAIEALKDCAKKATDEHPLVVLPVEATPEDASALTPGAESEAA